MGERHKEEGKDVEKKRDKNIKVDDVTTSLAEPDKPNCHSKFLNAN